MKRLFLGLILLIQILFATTTFAQDVKVTAKLDTNFILIGDQVNLKLSATGSSDKIIIFPDFFDSIQSKLEIVSKSKVDTTYSKDKKQKTLNQTLTLTTFDSGQFTIPAIIFQYKNNQQDTTTYNVQSLPIILNVNTVAIDTTLATKDIKSTLDAPYTLSEFLPYILIGLGILLLLIAIIVVLNYRKKKLLNKSLPPKPKLPPDKLALTAFETLRNKKLWQNEMSKEYHSELTEILRVYFEQFYGIDAMEMVSDEILEAFIEKNQNKEHLNLLREILTTADLVKFAKSEPLPAEHELSLSNAIRLVIETYNDKNSNITNLNG
ncbi:MAG: BatD family protein [Bacteroidota bacterium]